MTNTAKPSDIEAWLGALGAPSADRDYKPGHARIQALIKALERKSNVFHKPKVRIRIAGTNGKGSTANFLAAALQANGLRVGLYTSPHILQFNERIKVDGTMVADEALLGMMSDVMPLALEVGTSYFETATVLALLYFSKQQVDVEILEAGVGAKLDATTAVAADVGLLTPVGLDHQDWLGDTLESIAQEKAYIFQGCDICMSAPQLDEVQHVLNTQSKRMTYAPLFEDKLNVVGQHQHINAGLAFATMKQLTSLLPQLDINKAKQAMQHTQIDGRLQQVQSQGHTFWLDAAHNDHAIRALLPTLKAMGDPFDVIFLATREDRDLSGVVVDLQPLANKVVRLTGEETHDYASVSQALSCEVSSIQDGKFLVLGSFMTIAETLRWLRSEHDTV